MLKRMRRRYLALKIDSNETFSSREFMDAVWNAVLKLYGEHGASRSGLTLIDYDAEKRLAVIRTMHTTVEMVRAALASITKIQDKPAAIHVLKVSGTIRALYKKIKQ
ncbi:MAG: Rpp14/Pop5 family protein [Candidatus Bathyarchaeota archaeon]|nr:Rpp14/Pop5 family protein [Candidatus Bathyarchaeota archaeon]